jgi:hypothetical protein
VKVAALDLNESKTTSRALTKKRFLWRTEFHGFADVNAAHRGK